MPKLQIAMARKAKKFHFFLEYKLTVLLILVGTLIFYAGMVLQSAGNESGLIIPLGFGLSILLMWLVSMWWQRQFEKPIEKLEKALDKILTSKKWKGVRIQESKELADLTSHFNTTLKHIRDTYGSRQKVLDKKSQEVTNLSSQLKEITASSDTSKDNYERRIQELSILRELSERIGYSLDMQNIVDVITGSLDKLLDFTSISYMLWEGDKIAFRCHLEQSVPGTYVLNIKRKMLESMRALRGQDIAEDHVIEVLSGAVLDETIKADVGSYFNGPLVIRGETVGILNIASTKKQNYSESEMTLLYTITKQVSNAVAKLQGLLESEKGRLNAMVVSMVDGVVMTDSDLKITVINPAVKQLLGMQEMDSPTMFDIVEILRSQVNFKEKLEESLKLDRVVAPGEIALDNRYLQLLVAPVKDPVGESLGVVAIFHDVTETKELEQLREDFTSMMVHELRSPLDGIRKITEVLQKPETETDPQANKEFIQMIHKSSSEMLELVSDLLDIAKLEAGKIEIKPSEGSIASLLEDRQKYYQGLADEAKVELSTQLPESKLALASFDEGRVKQVLNNLLSNAIKFTDPGGKVVIEAFMHNQGTNIHKEAHDTGLLWQFASDAELGADLGNALVVAVSDTGMGIRSEHAEDLFNKFKQFEASTHSSKRGTGLGLAIAKGIVEAHKGIIKIGSEEGKGTTVMFTIPV